MRGRKPKPTALKLAQGNPGKRKINRTEPSPPGKTRQRLPDPPAFLDRWAKMEWNRMGRILQNMGLLTDVDLKPFAAYCVAWGQLVRAEYAIKKDGEVIESDSGYLIQSPWVAIRNRANEQLKGWASEFGFTPSARTRLHITGPGDGGDDAASAELDQVSSWLFKDHPKRGSA